jgi:hypothetical protein
LTGTGSAAAPLACVAHTTRSDLLAIAILSKNQLQINQKIKSFNKSQPYYPQSTEPVHIHLLSSLLKIHVLPQLSNSSPAASQQSFSDLHSSFLVEQ